MIDGIIEFADEVSGRFHEETGFTIWGFIWRGALGAIGFLAFCWVFLALMTGFFGGQNGL